ncbi:DUF7661 family protein [Klebsiella aerogenes]
MTLWFPLLIWWTPLCQIHQIMTRRLSLNAYDEIAGWLDDIFHEAATERHPDVKRIE